MPNLVSDGAEFSCNFCTSKLKLKVMNSSSTGDSQKLANQTNCLLPPPGGNCTFPPGVPPPPCAGVPPGMVIETGQTTVKVDGQTALGEGSQFMCPLFGQPVAHSDSGQEVAKNDEASTASEVASLAADFTPFVGSGKSFLELITGTDPITGEAVSRLSSAAGIVLGLVPGGKALIKGKKAAKVAKKVLKQGATKQAAKTAEDKAIKEYFVYQSKNASGKVDYVGITNNLERRAYEHSKINRSIQPIEQLKFSTRKEARSVEQALIEINGGVGKNKTGELMNQINSISPKNPIYQEQVRKGAEILKDINYPGAEEFLKKLPP